MHCKGRFIQSIANRKTAQQLKIDNLVVQVRVLNISNGDQILEIKLKLSLDAAHLPTHTVSSITDQAELVQDCSLNRRALMLCLKTWVQKEEYIVSGILTLIPSEYKLSVLSYKCRHRSDDCQSYR